MHEVFLSDDCVKIKKNIFEKWSIHTIFVQPLWSWGGGVIKFIMFLLPYTCSILYLKNKMGHVIFKKVKNVQILTHDARQRTKTTCNSSSE